MQSFDQHIKRTRDILLYNDASEDDAVDILEASGVPAGEAYLIVQAAKLLIKDGG